MNDGVYPGGIHTMVTVLEPGTPLDLRQPDHGGNQHDRAPQALVDQSDVEHTTLADGEQPETVVRLLYDRFAPDILTVNAGIIVPWVEEDGHGRVHAIDVRTFRIPGLRTFEQWQLTFDEVGVFDYECPHHCAMIGFIRVFDPAANGS